MKTEHACHLGQQLVLCKLQLGLVSVTWLVVWVHLVRSKQFFLLICKVWLTMLRQVPLEHGVSHHVDVDDVIKDRIAKSFKLFVVCIELVEVSG